MQRIVVWANSDARKGARARLRWCGSRVNCTHAPPASSEKPEAQAQHVAKSRTVDLAPVCSLKAGYLTLDAVSRTILDSESSVHDTL